MLKHIPGWGLVVIFLVSCGGGCQSTSSGPPSDPLFVSRKPILSRSDGKTGVAYVTPDAPADGVTPTSLTVRGQMP
jgi:hypothetical protein